MRSEKKKSKTYKHDSKDALERLKRAVTEASVDLLTLEVNSVLALNISGVYPNDDVGFLHETCDDLVEFFESFAGEKDANKVQQLLRSGCLLQLNELCNEKELPRDDCRIRDLRIEIKDCLKHTKPEDLDRKQSQERSEYRRYLHYLKKYLDLHYCQEWEWGKKMLKGREHQQLRTLWELVDATCIYAQTVLQLDGDIVFRINERLFTEAGDNAKELMHFHSLNVEAGTTYRNELIKTFVQILRTLTGALLHR